jgi:hypothetical protein
MECSTRVGSQIKTRQNSRAYFNRVVCDEDENVLTPSATDCQEKEENIVAHFRKVVRAKLEQ